MHSVKKFCYDHWEEVTSDKLAVGDMISLEGQVAHVTGEPFSREGVTHLPTRPYAPGSIKLAFGEACANLEHIIMAMDMVGSELQEFDDGTALITCFEFGSSHIYSPRLPLEELNSFCFEHLERYQAFYDQHASVLEDGENVPMEPWWLPGYARGWLY